MNFFPVTITLSNVRIWKCFTSVRPKLKKNIRLICAFFRQLMKMLVNRSEMTQDEQTTFIQSIFGRKPTPELIELYNNALARKDHPRPSNDKITVDVLRTDTSRGPDFFVRIQCGTRSVTPHVFRERYKAEYEAAHFAWIFGLRPDEPDLMAYDEDSHPNES